MSDTTSSEAVNDAPLSMAEAISQLSSPEPADSPADADQGQQEEGEDDGETQDDGQTDDQADDEGATEEDQVDDEASDEAGEEDEEQEISGGRFAADDAKVRLEDGTFISVAELKRNNLYQRDYSRKTAEVSEQRKALEAKTAEYKQLESEIARQRELVQTFAQRIVPKKPDISMLDIDPVGYLQAQHDYESQVRELNELSQHEQARRQREQAETAEQANARRLEEAQKLQALMPELADPKKYEQFFTNTLQVMSKYGYSAEEVSAAEDHRMYPIFKALQRLERIDAAKGKVQEKVEGKPPVMRGGKRPNPGENQARAREAARDRLNKSGSIADAVALLSMR